MFFVSLRALNQLMNLQAFGSLLCPAISLDMQIKFDRTRDLDVRDASVDPKCCAKVPHAVWGLSGYTAPNWNVLCLPVVIITKLELYLDGLLGGCIVDECDVDL